MIIKLIPTQPILLDNLIPQHLPYDVPSNDLYSHGDWERFFFFSFSFSYVRFLVLLPLQWKITEKMIGVWILPTSELLIAVFFLVYLHTFIWIRKSLFLLLKFFFPPPPLWRLYPLTFVFVSLISENFVFRLKRKSKRADWLQSTKNFN